VEEGLERADMHPSCVRPSVSSCLTITLSIKEAIYKEYPNDKVFGKVLLRVDRHPMFSLKNRLICAQTRGGEEDVVCVPSTKSQDTNQG